MKGSYLNMSLFLLIKFSKVATLSADIKFGVIYEKIFSIIYFITAILCICKR